jgi:ankyrin repeat protein
MCRRSGWRFVRRDEMGLKVKGLGGCGIVILLSVASLTAAHSDLRLVEAVKKGDREAVSSLLKQRVNVNARQLDGATALAWAAHQDDLKTAELLIHAGANVNAANDYGVTPLWLACSNANAGMVEKLLKAGANSNATLSTGETALMRAARTGDVNVVKLLLAQGATANAKETRGGQTALMWAVAENHTEVVQALIEHGADVHARSKGGFTPLLFAAQQGNLDSARILLSARADVNEATPEGGSALVVASASGHEAFAILLLDRGANPNVADGSGITPLHYTVFAGLSTLRGASIRWPGLSYLFRPNMPELAKALLARGANPNARIVKGPLLPMFFPIVISPVGATPFLLAATTYDASLMRVLVAGGADPLLATEDNTTPLIMAAGLGEAMGNRSPLAVAVLGTKAENRSRSLEAVKVAAELGADVNAANAFGTTAMHGAAYLRSDAVIQFLVDKGAKVNEKDVCGQTPLSIAQSFKKIVPVSANFSGVCIYLGPRSPTPGKNTVALLLKSGATPLTVPGNELADAAAVDANQ